jgi:hypothetical protein
MVFLNRDTQQLQDINVNASCIKTCDFDSDGFIDVFIGGRSVPGRYGVWRRIATYSGTSNGVLKNSYGSSGAAIGNYWHGYRRRMGGLR